MVQSKINTELPLGSELPDSDDTPVDNEEQNLLPNILLFILNQLWADKPDWYFGVDMGIYHTAGKNPRVPVIPDAFLSVGVPRYRGDTFRRNYVVWEENDIVPTLTLEMVSWSPGNEYIEKLELYRKLGVLYYVIYNPNHWQRDGHLPFEVYKLIEGDYQLQIGEPYWMPEVNLGIGRYRGKVGDKPMELLGWFEQTGRRILTAEEQAEQAQQKIEQAQNEAKQAQSKAEQLAARLRELGEDPDAI